jgi:hypothetical protein
MHVAFCTFPSQRNQHIRSSIVGWIEGFGVSDKLLTPTHSRLRLGEHQLNMAVKMRCLPLPTGLSPKRRLHKAARD